IAGFLVRGTAARILLLLFSLTCFASGIGMLRKWRWAHSLAIGYFVFGLINSLGLLIPGAISRMRIAIDQVPAGNRFPSDMADAFLWFGLISGSIFTGVMLWFLITRRGAFVAGGVLSQPPSA